MIHAFKMNQSLQPHSFETRPKSDDITLALNTPAEISAFFVIIVHTHAHAHISRIMCDLVSRVHARVVELVITRRKKTAAGSITYSVASWTCGGESAQYVMSTLN